MLHLVVGPETELFGDIHGAAVLDVTSLLMEMDGARHVFLTLTQCRSERVTTRNMQSAGIPHISSFGSEPEGAPAGNVGPETLNKTPQQDTAETGKQAAATTQKGHCEYCKQDMQLLPVPGFHICKVCAQIELGRLKQNTAQDTPDDTEPV
jgi:hypothetical protein